MYPEQTIDLTLSSVSMSAEKPIEDDKSSNGSFNSSSESLNEEKKSSESINSYDVVDSSQINGFEKLEKEIIEINNTIETENHLFKLNLQFENMFQKSSLMLKKSSLTIENYRVKQLQ